MTTIPISLLIPLLHIKADYVPPLNIGTFTHIDFFELTEEMSQSSVLASSDTIQLSVWNIVGGGYWLGFIWVAVQLVQSVYRLWLLKSKSSTMKKGNNLFFIADIPAIFSCFHWIFVPIEGHKQVELSIIEHEKAHVRLGHTWDLIIMEIYAAICWFNPFIYWYKKSLRNIHEFQADEAVLKKPFKKSSYLALLLDRVILKEKSKFQSYFQSSTIKKRVTMITKTYSSKKMMFGYLLFLPVVVMLSWTFVERPHSHNHIRPPFEVYLPPSIHTPPSDQQLAFIFPIANLSINDISSGYGNRKHPIFKKLMFHTGIDVRAVEGTPIIASASGKVTSASEKKDWGNLVIISHADGYETWYAHLKEYTVSDKQEIKKGDIIGYVGNTGLSRGFHLHFEIKVNGKSVNPIPLLED